MCRVWLVLMVWPWTVCAQSAEQQFQKAMELAGSGKFAEAETVLRALETAHPQEFEIR
jgi:hypothetical protein